MASQASEVTSATLRSLFQYKAWANEELLAALGTLDSSKHPVESHTAIRILNHVYVVDCIFRAHLAGVAHSHVATNTKETPSLHALAAAARDVDAWFIAYVNELPSSALQEQVPFVFTDRVAGESKLNQKEIFNYLKQLGKIYSGRMRPKTGRT